MATSDQRATLARISRALAGVPPRRLRLFALLPAIYRDGAIDDGAVVRLAPEITSTVAETEEYVRAVEAYRTNFLAAIDRAG